MNSSWSLPRATLLIAIGVLPAQCQDCTPSAPETEPSMYCPSAQANYDFTATFPDGHPIPGSIQAIGECVPLYRCDANLQIQPNGYKQCPPHFSVMTFNGGYTSRYTPPRAATQYKKSCGATEYTYDAQCGGWDYPVDYATVHYACYGCYWHNPNCLPNQNCVNNQCQCNCGSGAHCEGSLCCVNGCTTCQQSCAQWCENYPSPPVCLECMANCPNGQRPTCYNGQPYCPPSPIVLDSFNEGFHLTSTQNGVRFRATSDGPLHQISWTDPAWRNGWLVLDRNGNGRIDSLGELFGDLTPQPPTGDPNGFRALAVFDEPASGGDGNGFIGPADAVYTHLRVWIDANHDGISTPNELYPLQVLGIFKIGLRYHNSPFVDQYGNRFRYRGTVWDDTGHGRDVCYDVFLLMRIDPGAQ